MVRQDVRASSDLVSIDPRWSRVRHPVEIVHLVPSVEVACIFSASLTRRLQSGTVIVLYLRVPGLAGPLWSVA